jgi:hypothetical protein
MYRVPDPKKDFIILTSRNQTVDIRKVDADRLATVQECDEVLFALRLRIERIARRMNERGLDRDQTIRCRDAMQYAQANQERVKTRLKALLDAVPKRDDSATAFFETAKRRLNRDVFQAIMREASGR